MMSNAEKSFYDGKIAELDLEVKRLHEENKQLRNFISRNLVETDIRVDNILTSDFISDSIWFNHRTYYISKPFTAEMINKFITKDGIIQVCFSGGDVQFYELITNDDKDIDNAKIGLIDPNCLHIILFDDSYNRYTILKDNYKVLENYFNYLK